MNWLKKSEITGFNGLLDRDGIIQHFREGDEMVRYHMVYQLGKLAETGDEEARKLLEHAITNDPSAMVKNMAVQCMQSYLRNTEQ